MNMIGNLKERRNITLAPLFKDKSSKKWIVWLTGNTGAGKSSLAYPLGKRLKAIVLDGDELRKSISVDLGFSKKDRDEHNMRVARLAKLLQTQGYNVVVAVIAPFQSTRDKITRLIAPLWVYVKGGAVGKDKPYEVPKNPDLIIDPTKERSADSLTKIVKKINGLG